MIGPCVHPRCKDADGNRRLTTDNLCGSCRNHLRRQIDWLRDDYLILKAFMPRPVMTEDGKRVRRVIYGHPNEWATDTARLIAQKLNSIEDDLREELGDDPPANIYTADEAHLIVRAHHYLTTRYEALVGRDHDIATDAAVTVHELHGTIRHALGYNKERQHLDGIPCPTCDVAALVRSVGQIDCESCGRIIPEDKYPMLTRIITTERLDALLNAYDTAHATPATLDETGVAVQH